MKKNLQKKSNSINCQHTRKKSHIQITLFNLVKLNDLIKKMFYEQANIFSDIQSDCQACIENTTKKVVDLKELLIKTYHTVNMQCDKNSFKECIDGTLILLQESFKKLQEVKERIDIYCQEVQEKIQTLQKNASFYPFIYVRDIITRIKDSIHINQGEQNSTKANELKILSQQVFFEEKLNIQPVIKGASLDMSMYYLYYIKQRATQILLVNVQISDALS
ncbi:hypothetical protein ABPG74_012728 [Tetrahymena malaccensis]